MTNLIILIVVGLILLFGIYLAVKKESKTMRLGALLFTLIIVSEVILTSTLILA